MKIIQINAWNGNLVYPLIRFIKEQNPDIVCMQEATSSNVVAKNVFDVNNYKIVENIKEILPYNYFSPTTSMKFMNSQVKFGNAIFSKYKITNQITIFVSGQYAEMSDVNFNYNVRNIQSCTLDINNRSLAIVNHHGYHDLNPLGNDISLDCMRTVVNHIKRLNTPLIFCGDLNVTPGSRPIKLLEENIDLVNHVVINNTQNTISSVHRTKNLKLVCDYIYTSKDLETTQFIVADDIISDHKALVLEFKL